MNSSINKANEKEGEQTFRKWEANFFRVLQHMPAHLENRQLLLEIVSKESWQSRLVEASEFKSYFICEWLKFTHKEYARVTRYITKQHLDWANVPHYLTFIKSFLTDIVDLDLATVGEIAINTSKRIVLNTSTLTFLVKILYRKAK